MGDEKPAFETVYPLRRTDNGTPQPFPTIYWLSDPSLDHQLAELERLGYIGRFEQHLADDAELLAAYHADHVRYRDSRWSMLTDADRTTVESSPSLLRSFRGGIAGIANFDTVKCLQAQYAYHLAAADRGGSVVGHLIDEQLV
ncbi:MAG: DUF501 domain-containing protein [Planctomycetota bacterium]